MTSLKSSSVEDAVHEALDYAEVHGLSVVVLDAGEEGREVAALLPTLQTDAVPFPIEQDMHILYMHSHLN
jgi:hypothetical protein